MSSSPQAATKILLSEDKKFFLFLFNRDGSKNFTNEETAILTGAGWKLTVFGEKDLETRPGKKEFALRNVQEAPRGSPSECIPVTDEEAEMMFDKMKKDEMLGQEVQLYLGDGNRVVCSFGEAICRDGNVLFISNETGTIYTLEPGLAAFMVDHELGKLYYEETLEEFQNGRDGKPNSVPTAPSASD